MHNSNHYYEYKDSGGIIVCGECLDDDLLLTKQGHLVGDERVYQGMYSRVEDDQTEAYMCDKCGTMNEAYENLGEYSD